MLPGDTISPHQKDSDNQGVEVSIPRGEAQPTDASPSVSPLAAVVAPQQAPQPDQKPSWQYSQESESPSESVTPSVTNPVRWTASEFVDHQKASSWFIGLAFITGVAVAIIYLITHDLITAFVIIIAAILFGVTAKRKPRTLEYQIDNSGIHIDQKTYIYGDFKSFSVMDEGVFNSIQLMPMKRFMPALSLYFPADAGDKVVELLGAYLPYEERAHDAIDNLMRKVRF